MFDSELFVIFDLFKKYSNDFDVSNLKLFFDDLFEVLNDNKIQS